MRKVKIGKRTAVVAVLMAVLCVGLAYGAVVNYLSNPVTTQVTVESPIELKLYDSEGTEISTMTELPPLKGGEAFRFIKVAHNKGENGVPFAIALVIKGKDVGEAVIVDSAGPVNDVAKARLGTEPVWDSELWCQNEGEAWYLHGAHDAAKVEAYHDWGKYSTGTEFTNPINEIYVDAITVNKDGAEYYVVIFGGTIGGTGTGIPDPLPGLDAEVTRWGWGTPNSYTANEEGEPLIIPGWGTNPESEGYDVGKVRIIFASNYVTEEDEEPVKICMRVVVPGTTIREIIEDMGL